MNINDVVRVHLLRASAYQNSQQVTATAMARYSEAQQTLALAQQAERTAELASQTFESIAKGALQARFATITDREREIGLAFARYATFGRTDPA